MFHSWQFVALCLLASQALVSATPLELFAEPDANFEEFENAVVEGTFAPVPSPTPAMAFEDMESINAAEPSFVERPMMTTSNRDTQEHVENFENFDKKCAAFEEPSIPLACSAARLGRTRDCPAVSCRMILEINPLAEDGIFFCHVLDKREREIIFPVFCLMSEGGFTMVTKIPTTTNATSAAEFWLANQEVNEGYKQLLQLGQPESDRVAPYKNRLVRHWTSTVDWTVARVALIKNGLVAQFMDFDVRDADRDVWFTKSRLLRSSWRDLVPSVHASHFSLRGLVPVQIDHTFLVAHDHVGSCDPAPHGAVGWMMSVGARPGCGWERPAGMPGLVWLYSTGLEMTSFNDIGGKIDVADSLVVLLR